MKKRIIVAVLLACALLLCACGDENVITSGGKKNSDKNSGNGAGTVTKGASDPFQGGSDQGDPSDPSQGGNPSGQDQDNRPRYVTTDPFGVEIPGGGGVNYEYVVYKIVTSDGREITEKEYLPKHSWFISYHRNDCTICIPLSDNAIGTEEYPIEPNFTSGTKEFTEYDREGNLGQSFVLRFNISSSGASFYDEAEQVTYYCSLYRTFSYTN